MHSIKRLSIFLNKQLGDAAPVIRYTIPLTTERSETISKRKIPLSPDGKQAVQPRGRDNPT